MNVQIFALFALLAVATVMAGCPEEDGENAVYFANEDDCTTFYQCSNGEAFLHQCPEGTAWSERKETCDWTGDDGCAVVEEEAEEEAAEEAAEVAAVPAAVLPRAA